MRLVILPGDGIGPEIAAATGEVLRLVNEKLSLKLTLETHEVGLARLEREGMTFPASVMEACRAAEGIILRKQAQNRLDSPPLSTRPLEKWFAAEPVVNRLCGNP